MASRAPRLVAAGLPTSLKARINVGDIVRTGENAYPQYRVIATSGDRAWIRDVQYGTDGVVPIACCRKVGLSPSTIREASSRIHRLLPTPAVRHFA